MKIKVRGWVWEMDDGFGVSAYVCWRWASVEIYNFLLFCFSIVSSVMVVVLFYFKSKPGLSCFMTDDSDGNDALMISWWWRSLSSSLLMLYFTVTVLCWIALALRHGDDHDDDEMREESKLEKNTSAEKRVNQGEREREKRKIRY